MVNRANQCYGGRAPDFEREQGVGQVARQRFKMQGEGNLFAEIAFERIVPEDRSLRQLDEMVRWQRHSDELGGRRGC